MVFVQKSSMAGLNCYPGRLAYGCCLGMQILRRFPPSKDKSGSLCLNCLNKQCGLYATPAFHLASGIWVCARQRLPTWSVPSPNIEHWVASELPWWATLHVFSHVGLVVGGGGGWSRSFVTPLRGDPWKLAPGFPRLCPGASSFADCARCPFTIIRAMSTRDAGSCESAFCIIKPGVVLKASLHSAKLVASNRKTFLGGRGNIGTTPLINLMLINEHTIFHKKTQKHRIWKKFLKK